MVKRVCVIIPAYNEARVIEKVVSDARSLFKHPELEIDVIVINDGSKDKTSQCARSAGAVVVDHILNTGAGSATATGLSYAARNRYDIAATMDADGQHDPADVLNGIHELNKRSVDLLIGSRLTKRSTNRSEMSTVKRIGNNGLSVITFLLFGVKVTDSQSGLRIYSRKALDQLRWKTSGYEFCTEMLWRARRAKLLIDEYPIRSIYTDYSKKKGQNNWNGVNVLKSLLRQRIVELFE